ncbi:hypothetical protein BDZ89DRAFT_1064387 [Hymenopellis radicata]|nr:hypothetical protein BDZ89DRAFT_1064387 [Hymenopellis radicata]
MSFPAFLPGTWRLPVLLLWRLPTNIDAFRLDDWSGFFVNMAIVIFPAVWRLSTANEGRQLSGFPDAALEVSFIPGSPSPVPSYEYPSIKNIPCIVQLL